ncbi:hypothetical protein [Roseateles sp.]|uniref:hypothetical protein n=1 Tax=Roseateles sp. TaxID=1971397 RepID=UPI003264D7CE
MSIDANASTPASPARRLSQYSYPHRWGALLTVLAYIGAAATEPMIPKLIGYAFGEGFTKSAFPLWMVPVVLISLYLCRGLFDFAGQYLFNWTLTRSVLDFRTALVEALLKLDAQVYPACSRAPPSPRSSTTRSRSFKSPVTSAWRCCGTASRSASSTKRSSPHCL